VDWYPWLVLIHVVGAFTFVLSHGVSVFAAFVIRREQSPQRIGAMLDLSSMSLGGVYLGLLILLAAGIAAGFMGNHWGRAWIWVSLGVLVALVVAMYPLGSSYYARVRRAVGQRAYGDAKDAPPPDPVGPAELAAVLSSPRPFLLAGLGGTALGLLLALMVFKPF
jgi:hypothetical protein